MSLLIFFGLLFLYAFIGSVVGTLGFVYDEWGEDAAVWVGLLWPVVVGLTLLFCVCALPIWGGITLVRNLSGYNKRTQREAEAMP